MEADNTWYDGAPGQILFADGQSATVIDFPLRGQPSDDNIDEMRVTLRKPAGKAELGPVPQMVIRVHNDVAGGKIQFASDASEVIAVEGDLGKIVMVTSDGKNRVPFDLEYQLLPTQLEELVEGKVRKIAVSLISKNTQNWNILILDYLKMFFD